MANKKTPPLKDEDRKTAVKQLKAKLGEVDELMQKLGWARSSMQNKMKKSIFAFSVTDPED